MNTTFVLTLLACAPNTEFVDTLQVINIAPPHGAVGIAVDTTLSVTFSADLDDSSLATQIYLEDGEGFYVSSMLSYDTSTYTAIMIPEEPLEPGLPYTLTLDATLESPLTGRIAAPVLSTFVTYDGSDSVDRAPVADLRLSGETCFSGFSTTIDGSRSYDPEGGLLEYTWRIAEQPWGATASLVGDGNETTTFWADDAGDYLIGLVVSDGTQPSDEAYLLVTCDTED